MCVSVSHLKSTRTDPLNVWRESGVFSLPPYRLSEEMSKTNVIESRQRLFDSPTIVISTVPPADGKKPNGKLNHHPSVEAKPPSPSLEPNDYGQHLQQQQAKNRNGNRGGGSNRQTRRSSGRNGYRNRNSPPRSPAYYPCSLCYPRRTCEYACYVDSNRNSQSNENEEVNNFKILSLSECAYLYSNYRKRSSMYPLLSDDFQVLQIGQRTIDLRDVRYDVLTFDQVRCLNNVLEQTIKIKSNLHMEVLEFSLLNLIRAVKDRLLEKNAVLYDIRLNGGAASHVLSLSSNVYNDIDLIFSVDLKNNSQFELVRESVLEVLLDLIPPSICERRRVIETFVNKMVKVEDVDHWSLISLTNYAGRNVELKFVDSMRRQYEFSVDSFQIILDTLLQFCLINNSESHPMTYNFYPTVVGESMFGNFCEAMYHLHHRLIVTKKPEEIRGGGLLKYCSLLVRNFYPSDESKTLEPYMSTRFFIDYFYQGGQHDRLNNYMITHFGNDSVLKYNFMVVFFNIIRRPSSVANHHQMALLDFEKITMQCYSNVLMDYLHHYITDYSKMQEFFFRCQDIRNCNCPRNLRSCIHKYLKPVYTITTPVIVTFVDDIMDDSVSKEERRRNLIKLAQNHDDIFPVYGGFSFAFLPNILFDCPDANHYVVTSSTLCTIPSARFMKPQRMVPESMYSFMMKMTSGANSNPQPQSATQPSTQQPDQPSPQSQQPLQPVLQMFTLATPNMLPESFYPIDHPNPNVITPALAYHFFPPITPPTPYRLCIMNRVPIEYQESVASGPIFHSTIPSLYLPQPKMPPTTAIHPNTSQSVSQMDGANSQIFPPPHHHHYHHHHHHQHYYTQSSFAGDTDLNAGQWSGSNRNRGGGGGGKYANYQPQQQQVFYQEPVEPLRIIYPRSSPDATPATETAPSLPTVEELTLQIPQISINDDATTVADEISTTTPVAQSPSSSSAKREPKNGSSKKPAKHNRKR